MFWEFSEIDQRPVGVQCSVIFREYSLSLRSNIVLTIVLQQSTAAALNSVIPPSLCFSFSLHLLLSLFLSLSPVELLFAVWKVNSGETSDHGNIIALMLVKSRTPKYV